MKWKSISCALAIALACTAVAAEKPRLAVSVPCGHLTEQECKRASSLADQLVPALADASSARGTFDIAPQCAEPGNPNAVRLCYLDALLAVGAKGLEQRSPEGAEAWLLLVFTPGTGVDASVHGVAYLVPRSATWIETQFSLRPIDSARQARPRWLVDGGALPKYLAEQQLANSVRPRGKFAAQADTALFGHAIVIEED
ncbi:MAG TPA: hypothetical protein VEK57_07560 [Thermoanaerobaculia bacterium]|nr:hypothetical protein [Thermoanaerobaculia bacterium]